MSAFQRRRSQHSAPEPEYDNLEVRCTWSGEYEEVADVRITLDVKCAPNTQLQLLSLRGPAVFLEDTYLERVPETDTGTDDQEPEPPQSPLFGFSPLGGRDDQDLDIDASDDSVVRDVSTCAAPIPGENEDAFDDCEGTQDGSRFHDAKPTLESSVGSAPTARSQTPSCSPESEIEGLNRPRKRSATDAEFPDSGSDVDDERGGTLRDVSHRKARQLNSVESTSRATVSKNTSPRNIALPRSPKKSTPTRIPGLVANENARPRSPGKEADAGVSTPETPKVSGQSPQKSSLIPKPTSTSPLKSSPSKSSPLKSPVSASFAQTAVGYHLANKNASENHAAIDSTKSSPVKEARVRFQLPGDAMDPAGHDGQPSSPSRSRNLGVDFERLNLGTSGDERVSRPENLEKSSRHEEQANVNQPEPFDHPEVKIINGLVILKNSERIRPATFKVTVTAVLFIPYPTSQGWSDFELTGMPKTGGGKIGIILFLMPADHGLEIRTTNVNRASIVENCLVAEFVNTGNLVIPLRRCERGSCGEISDFTVDQEIVSLNKANIATGSQDDKSTIEMDCHAVCFVRLCNRLFWSERCVIPLYVDGGPEGNFHCNVTAQPQQTKKIVIQAREGTRMGVSRIQVTCSPKDMDRLYLRWTLEFTGSKAAYWLPRVYSAFSTSHELSKHQLRNALLEVLNDPLYQCAGAEAREVDRESGSENSQSYEDIEPISEDEESDGPHGVPLQPTQSWPTLFRIERAVKMQVIRCDQHTHHFLRAVVAGLLCLIFLRIGLHIAGHIGEISSIQAPLQFSEQTSHVLPFPVWKNLFKSQEEVDDQGTSADLNILELMEEYGAIEVLEEPMPSYEQIKQVDIEVDEDEAEIPATFRDKVDYWLGWTGPV